MNRGIAFYRSLTMLWLLLFVAAIYFAGIGPSGAAISCIGLAAALILFQTLAFRCNNCATRPGLWLLAIWTLLLDFEFYIADVLLLRRCPKCETVFNRPEDQAPGSGRAA